MEKFYSVLQKNAFPIGIIIILALSRIMPHPPNFTPVIAVAIMSAYFFRNIYLAFSIILISMLMTDAFIGFHDNIIFVYLSLFLITFIFFKISNKVKFKNLFIFGFLGSLIFFLVSNFGVWASGVLSPITNLPYEKNLNGLINCYFLAIPFFTKTLISTIFFSYVAYLANFSLKKRFA